MTLARFLQHYGLFSLSIVLFAVCLANDGYYIAGPNPRAWAPAWGLLLVGWMGVFLSGPVAWFANPALVVAWCMFYFGRYGRATLFALIAAALMLSFLLSKTVVSSESTSESKVIGYGTGYWLWIASALVLLIGSILQWIFAGNAKVPNNEP
jgi:hypothetical protein